MLDAGKLAAEGAPHGSAVVAEEQTKGIGRHGHSWHSRGAAGVSTDIRWPNDVMLNEKKLAGIMIQSADQGALIAGIGVNVNQESFPPDIRDIATSLRIETGRAQDKEELLNRVLAESLRYAALPKQEVLKQFELNSTYVSGKTVEVDGRLRGVTAGLDADGFLKVNTATGMQTVFAGGVRPV
jgi:BirA family biotin operon repressor/biotin-[acetyl-CoA-carboxylase] ligase